ncbi:hypothetical protein EDB85DRAFT_1894231 [Lactarius pseudohatsudake]|nr:hypothetical protein EDB85DRAFT_1894231 [Lactarius pseudohatsudake]
MGAVMTGVVVTTGGLYTAKAYVGNAGNVALTGCAVGFSSSELVRPVCVSMEGSAWKALVPRMVDELNVVEDSVYLCSVSRASIEDSVVFCGMPVSYAKDVRWEIVVSPPKDFDPIVVVWEL